MLRLYFDFIIHSIVIVFSTANSFWLIVISLELAKEDPSSSAGGERILKFIFCKLFAKPFNLLFVICRLGYVLAKMV
jgi:hypothetical protein